MPVCRGRLVFRYLVSAENDRHKGQSTLRYVAAEDTCACHTTIDRVVVVGDVKGLSRGLAESLLAVPGEVVECEQRAVGDENHVEGSVADDDVVGLFDNFSQRTAVDS